MQSLFSSASMLVPLCEAGLTPVSARVYTRKRIMPEPRDRKHPLKVVVSAKERETIQENAKAARLSVSAFLRNLGMGHQPSSSFDREAIRKMVKLHADQGRLGGLLKLWLSEQPGKAVSVGEVRSVLFQIESLQQELARLVMAEKKRL